MSTIKVNTIEPATAGSENYFLARAWVNFDGTGTVAIRASGNVSSITDRGTGLYTLNIGSALQSANYTFNGKGAGLEDAPFTYLVQFQPSVGTKATTSIPILTGYVSGTNYGSYRALQDLAYNDAVFVL